MNQNNFYISLCEGDDITLLDITDNELLKFNLLDDCVKKISERYPKNHPIIKKRIEYEAEFIKSNTELLNILIYAFSDNYNIAMEFMKSFLLAQYINLRYNPLPAHYHCDNCNKVNFIENTHILELKDFELCGSCKSVLRVNGFDSGLINLDNQKKYFNFYKSFNLLAISKLKRLATKTEKFNKIKSPEILESPYNYLTLHNYNYTPVLQKKFINYYNQFDYKLSVLSELKELLYANETDDEIKKTANDFIEYLELVEALPAYEYLKIYCFVYSTFREKNNLELYRKYKKFYSMECLWRYLLQKGIDEKSAVMFVKKIRCGIHGFMDEKSDKIDDEIIINIMPRKYQKKMDDPEFIEFCKNIVYLWSEKTFFYR